MLSSFFLPEGILDWFDVVRMEESDNDKPAHELDVLYPKVLHIYLDERDKRQGEGLGFVANGFTEESVIHDYPARSRKMVLHAAQLGYLDEQRVVYESLIAIKRAGAQFIIAYYAKEYAQRWA